MASTLLGSLLVSLGLESGAFKSGLSDAEKALRASRKRIEAVGEGMVNMGQKLSLSVTAPLVALGAASVKAAMESKDAIGQVNSALASMGNVAGRTSEQLSGMAEGLMKQSLFDDDEILRKVTANLLTFGNVAGEQFDKAQLAAVNLAARMGTDLQSAALMVGKALNDPVKGINALKRAGIQFTEQQQEQIKAMAAAGNMAGAQSLMLKELERQFGGAAKAARDANPFAVLQQSWAEFQEKVGDQLLKAMPAITSAITSILEAFNSLSPGMQKFVVIAGVLAAALGPVLIGLGAIVTATAPFAAALGSLFASGGILAAGKGLIVGLTAAFGPWGIAIAAVAAGAVLIYTNWDKIAPVLQNLWQTIQTTIGPPFMALVEALKAALTALWNGPMGPAIKTAATLFMQFNATLLNALGPTLIGAIKLIGSVVGTTFTAMAVAVRMITALFDGSFRISITGAVKAVYEAVKTWLTDKLNAVWNTVKEKIEAAKGWFRDLYIAVVGNSYVPDMVDGIAEQMKRLDAVMVDPAKRATAKTKDAFRQLATDVRAIMDDLFPDIAAMNASGQRKNTLTAGFDAGLMNRGTFSAAIDAENTRLAGSLPANDNAPAAIAGWDQASLVNMQSMNAELATFASTVSASIPSLNSFNGLFSGLGESFEGLREDLARSLTDVIMGAESFGEAMRGVFNRLATRILDNLINNLLGNLLGGIIPGFAGGTSFAPGGLAIVGEKGPELVNLPRGSQVIPNHDLKGMGGNNVNVTLNMVASGNPKADRQSASQAAHAVKRVLSPMKAA